MVAPAFLSGLNPPPIARCQANDANGGGYSVVSPGGWAPAREAICAGLGG